MLGRVGQRLRDDIVRADFDPLGQPPFYLHLEVDRDRGAAGERLQGRAETALGQDRGVNPASVLAQFIERTGQPGGHPAEFGAQLAELRRHRSLRRPQLEGERDEPLLCAVVQVALDLQARLVGRSDQTRT